MPSVTISAYQFKIRRVGTDEVYPLNDFFGGTDIFDELQAIMSEWSHVEGNTIPLPAMSDEDRSRALLVSRISTEGRTIKGVVHSGEYGFERTNFNVETGVNTGTIGVNEASTIPFQFMLHAPRNKDVGVLLCQRFNNSGMYGIFSEQMAKTFRERHEEYILDFEQIINRELANNWLSNGAIKNIVFTSIDSTIIANHIIRENGVLNSQDFNVELRIVAKRKRSALSHFFLRNRLEQNELSSETFRELVTVRGFEQSSVKLQVRMGGKQRTFRTEDVTRMGAFLDITDNIRINSETGLPDEGYVWREMREYLGTIQAIIYHGE